MLELVPSVLAAIHVVAAVAWLAALLVGMAPHRSTGHVPSSLRSLAEAVRLQRAFLVAVVALSGLGLTASELTERAGGRLDRAVVDDPSTLWVTLVAAKAALLAGVVGRGAGSGPVTVGDASGGASQGSARAAAATADRAVAVTAGLVGAALLLGLVADLVGARV